MPRYQLVIWWSATKSVYLAEAMELPGCMAEGATYEEALANVQAIIDKWIETARSLGREVPAPRGRLLYA